MGLLSDFSYWSPPIITIGAALIVFGIMELYYKIKERREKEKNEKENSE